MSAFTFMRSESLDSCWRVAGMEDGAARWWRRGVAGLQCCSSSNPQLIAPLEGNMTRSSV